MFNKFNQKEKLWSFLELLLVLIALILIIKKPEKENLAFGLVMVAWLLMVFFYVGHKTGALLTIMNL
ncbi:disulfide bond formation protein Dba [Campylobacter jejuni]|uniref:disulfide bond formation protein Dba n=2 Tax=Campylobacter TaxID=194 RepID=UPI0016550172|nr:dihydroneopterin aldolase [Campylobacter jejuni]